jgi:hypothetical protein
MHAGRPGGRRLPGQGWSGDDGSGSVHWQHKAGHQPGETKHLAVNFGESLRVCWVQGQALSVVVMPLEL